MEIYISPLFDGKEKPGGDGNRTRVLKKRPPYRLHVYAVFIVGNPLRTTTLRFSQASTKFSHRLRGRSADRPAYCRRLFSLAGVRKKTSWSIKPQEPSHH